MISINSATNLHKKDKYIQLNTLKNGIILSKNF